MKRIETVLLVFLFLYATMFLPILTHATETQPLDNPKSSLSATSLIGTWLIVVDGEVKTRTLTIKSIGPGKDGLFNPDCEYGYTGGTQRAVKVTMSSEGQKMRLTFVTPAENTITAIENSEGAFSGTFTSKNGASKKVSITRSSKNTDDLRYSVGPKSKITVVYFKSDHCIWCTRWESHEKEMFTKMAEYALINFITVIRESSERQQLPDDLKWLSDKYETGRGTPYFIVLANNNIVLKAFGKDNWSSKVLPLLKSLVAQKKTDSGR